MNIVGTYEAKGHFSQLLERVARGERITITKRGKPIAILVPALQNEKPDLKQIINNFIAYSKRQRRTLGRLTVRNMIEEGRRY
jgi:prevent-host-death family protein